jgi:hypothetical protein
MCREAHHRLGGAPVLASLATGPRRIARIDQPLGHWAEHDLLHLEQIRSTLTSLAHR